MCNLTFKSLVKGNDFFKTKSNTLCIYISPYKYDFLANKFAYENTQF